MKAFASALCVAATLTAAGAAHAQEDTGPSVAFNAGIASDYVFRGVSQTDEGPQVSLGADLTADIFYAGVWASNVDFSDSTDAEIDLYAGVRPTAGPVSLDFAAIYYGYVNAPSAGDYAYWELKAAGSIPVGPGTVGLAAYYSPDFFGSVDGALYYEVNGSVPVAEKWSLSGALGRQDLDGPGDYTTWNLGAAYALTDKLAVDLRYHDTNEHDFGDLYESRIVVSLKAAF